MEFSFSEIVLFCGLIVSGFYISFQQGKIENFKTSREKAMAYNTYLFNSHQKVGELSLSLVRSCEELTIENKRLNKIIKELEIRNVSQK